MGYEQELRTNAGLGGRILVPFTIAAAGQVLTLSTAASAD